jgi:tRNA (guanine10-N2)-dimethyltransferase
LTPQNPSHPTSGPSQSKEIVFLLSGESTSIPAAEARALLLMEDDSTIVRVNEPRVLTASSLADPDVISKRIAFSRRVGVIIPDGDLDAEQLRTIRKGTYRVSVFELHGKTDYDSLVSDIAEKIGGKVSLRSPEIEVTVVRGDKDYLALTKPLLMNQDWVTRRPRKRAFFHPAAIFPKLSRALVNLSQVQQGEVFLDPFCGTGSLLLEAYEIGAVPVGSDIEVRMVRGARRNMAGFDQHWLGLVRADTRTTPIRKVDAMATDVPYGRASSTSGSDTRQIMDALLTNASSMLPSGHRLVLMHPQTVGVEGGGGFDLQEEHQLYIHRKLTRTISVLRRV